MNVYERHDLIKRAHEIPKHHTLVGLDHGTKTIGVAVSDTLWMTATALGTVAKKKFTKDMEQLKNMLGAREIGAFVLGLPVEMDGTKGPRAQAVADYAHTLEAHVGRPCLLWEERLSTAEAERAMIAADLTRATRKKFIDGHAAAIILQSALDRLHEASRS